MKKFLFLLTLIFFQISIKAATKVASTGGWYINGLFTNMTWVGGTPVDNDRVVIDANGAAITMGGDPLILKTLRIKGNNSVSYLGTLTITDSLIIEGTSALPGQVNFSSGTYSIKDIILSTSDADGALFQTDGTVALSMTGSIIKNSNGSVTISSGTSFNLSGTSNQTIYGSGFVLGLTGKTAGTVNLGSDYSTSGAVSIPSGVTLNTNSFTLSGAGSLTVPSGGTLEVGGAFPTIATTTLSSGSTVNYTGAGQTVAAEAYDNLILSGSGTKTVVTGGATAAGLVSVIDNTTLDCGAGNLTLLSDATQTAGIGDLTSGTVTGTVTCQRYVAAQSVAGNPGWWYMIGAPVSGQTLNDLSDNINTTGFTGSTWPTHSFKSVVTYEPDSAQTQASASYYVAAKNITDVMTLGRGFYIYMADDTVGTIPKTLDWTGSVVEGTTVTMNQTATTGFNLIGNPVPCAISVNPANGTNVTQVHFQDDAGNFVAGTGNLAMGEAVWFETSVDGATYTFNESDKLSAAEVNQFHKSKNRGIAKVAGKELDIIIHRPYGHGDKARLILNDDGNATLAKDPYLDGGKVANFYGYTNVSFYHGSEEFSINQIPSNLGSNVIFPIRFWRQTSYNQNVQIGFEIKGVEDFKANGICLSLEDISTGNIISLDKDYYTQVNWFDANNQPLYNLILSSSFEKASTDATCYGFDDGSATANTSTTAKYDFYLTNLIGDTLQSEMGKVGNSHTFNNVKAGKYNLVVNDPNGCGLLAKPVEVTEPDPVLSFFTTPKNSIDLSVNPEVKFSNHSANAQSYLWHFGDGNSSMDFEPIHEYNSVGNYEVNLVAYNGTCTDTSTKSVLVENNSVGIFEVDENKNIQLFQANEKIELRFNLNQRELINARLVNVLGQEVWSSQGKTIQNEQLTFNLPEENTFYLLTIKGESFETNYKLIRR